MAKTLLDGFWYDRGTSLKDLQEEIATIDRVIVKRLKATVKVRELGLFVSDADNGMVIDDLLLRRKCVLDLVKCLELEEGFEPATSGRLQALIRMISRKRCDRFVG
jgi:hypothetical protein